MTKSDSVWRLGPSPYTRWAARLLLLGGLGGFLVGLGHWAVFGMFADEAVIFWSCCGGGAALVMGLAVGFVGLRTPRTVIDLEARMLKINGTVMPLAVAGPVALWTYTFTSSGGPNSSEMKGTATMLAIVFGSSDDGQTMLEQWRRRDEDPYRGEGGDEPIAHRIQEPWSLNINAGGTEAEMRMLANELADLWGNQVVNVTGRRRPDLTGAKLWLRPSERDLEVLDEIYERT